MLFTPFRDKRIASTSSNRHQNMRCTEGKRGFRSESRFVLRLTAYQSNFVALPTPSLHNTTVQKARARDKTSPKLTSPLLHTPSPPICTFNLELSIMVSSSPVRCCLFTRISTCRIARRSSYVCGTGSAKPWFVDDTTAGRTDLLAQVLYLTLCSP